MYIVSLCMVGCDKNEQDISTSEDKQVQFGVNILMPQEQSDIPLEISNYRLVLAEQISGFIIVNRTTLDNGLTVSLGSSIKVSVKPGKYRAYLIANESMSMTKVFSTSKFINEINDFVLDSQMWQAIEERSIPLLAINNIEIRSNGTDENMGLVSDNGGDFLNGYKAPLQRIMAKVSLKLNKESGYNYVIKNVNIIQTAETFKFGGNSINDNKVITINSFSGSLSLPQNVNNNYQSVFENRLISEKLFENQKDETKATIVRIDALVNNIPVTYNIPLGLRSETGYSDYQVVRNNHYLVQGTLSEIGDFIVSILPWDKESIDTEFNPLLQCSFAWKTGTNFINSNEVSISYNQSAECGFSLIRPSGKRWFATLSNGADFEFDYSDQAVSQGISRGNNGESSVIRIKAKRKMSTGSATTLTIYTEDGRKVPINPGNDNVFNIILKAE